MILLKISDVLRKINKWICHIGEVCIAGLMVLITVDVLLRLILNKPILGSFEICQMLLLISLYASFAYLQSEKGHVSVNILVDKFPPVVRTIILGLCYAVATVFCAIWAYGAVVQGLVYVGTGNETALLKIPYAPFYFFEGICMLALAVVMLVDTITLFCALGNKTLAAEVATWEGATTD